MDVGRALVLAVALAAAACGGESASLADRDVGPSADATSEGSSDATPDTRPELLDASGDTVNLFDVEIDEVAMADACVPVSCNASGGSGTYCGTVVAIKPYVARFAGGFQSVSGTGPQSTILIRFSKTVESVTVTAVEPDNVGNRIDAYDAAGKMIGTAAFDVDGKPTLANLSTKTVTAKGIASVQLVPGPSDFVWYQKLSFTHCP